MDDEMMNFRACILGISEHGMQIMRWDGVGIGVWSYRDTAYFFYVAGNLHRVCLISMKISKVSSLRSGYMNFFVRKTHAVLVA